ncbi:hypothetical protein XELAEV_18007653mg [Xenopus laevis]|uniref:GIY-YIG domain-containing protein n=1 Tax=Xenopus laevis TaxID=8355 RepID=A0A974E1R5_XENLA|nr:hypothetical protein XELAEV_18007653mg [Xenopus laevis]
MDLQKVLRETPIITYRRSRNLKDRLTRSHYISPQKTMWLANRTKGCYKCGSCKACPWVNKAIKISGRSDIKEYMIKDFINCKTTGVIYVMNCICGMRYVGKTKREWRRRILEHVGDVVLKRNTSVANHINECHDGDTAVMKFTGARTSRFGSQVTLTLDAERHDICVVTS